MLRYIIQDEFETSIEHYWEMFFSEDYNRGLYRHLRIGYEPIEFSRKENGDEEVIHRRINFSPDRKVHPLIARAAQKVQNPLRYQERGEFHRKTNSMRVETIPHVLSNKVGSIGDYSLRDLGEGKILRVWSGECTVKIPLIGGQIEKVIVAEVKRSYAATTDFTRRFLHEHPAP